VEAGAHYYHAAAVREGAAAVAAPKAEQLHGQLEVSEMVGRHLTPGGRAGGRAIGRADGQTGGRTGRRAGGQVDE
jgi:hypothetical protein